jgi:protein-S-isoprenylcysteine O-methyltransferase Ste14
VKKRLKTNGVVIVAGLVLAACFSRFFFARYSSSLLDLVLDMCGIAAIVFGQLLRVCGRGHKAASSRQGGRLVQDGPYAIVRNPMYLGILLIGLGIVMAVFRWWVALVFAGIFILRYVVLMRSEERKLTGFFGAEYAQYCRRVPRLFPRITSCVPNTILAALPLKVEWIKKEIGTMLAALFPVIAIDMWNDIGAYGSRVVLAESIGVIAIIGAYAIFFRTLIRRTSRHG